MLKTSAAQFALATGALLASGLTTVPLRANPAPAAAGAPAAPLPATVTVDFNTSRGANLRPERYNNLSRSRTFPAQRDADVAFFNEQGLLQFEQPNKERRYEVKLGDNDMTWSNQDGTSFYFEKMPEPKFVRRDVFGRPIPEKKKDEKEPK